MKFLDKREFVLGEKKCAVEMFLYDRIPSENIKEYIFDVEVEEGVEFEKDEIVNIFTNNLTEMFNGLKSDKEAIYIPSEHEVDVYGEGYIDVYYSTEYMQEALDKPYVTEDNEVGKNLLQGELNDKVDNMYKFELTVKSLVVVDEKNQLTSLWDMDNGAVFKFLKDNLLGSLE